MSSKAKARRQLALKKAKRRNRIIAAVCGVALMAIVAFFVISHIQQIGTRVFVSGRNSVTLNTDGTFSAILPHGVMRRGTFSETTSGGITAVSFVQDNTFAIGSISGNVLTIPEEWDDGHFHPRDFTLRR
ncbi:MAG: hypothetical protein FWC93_01680 [Defluviitaleaceae bacterium]|nr:hypothetical protein [Defluviitaleaceae bacterium]